MAVSDVIGSILLISVVVIAASVIAAAVLSTPQPENLPSLSAAISNQSNVVFIKHDGGDSLAKGTYNILVDGRDVTSDIQLPETWSIGDTLQYKGTAPPSRVQIVYNGYGTGGVVLSSAYFGRYTGGISPTGSPTGTATVSPTVTTTVSPTGTVSPNVTTTVTTSPTVTVSPTPVPVVADFSGTPITGLSPLEVSFTDLSTGNITGWLWDFGDGTTTGVNEENPVHLYTVSGTYTVNLTVSYDGGTANVSKVDYIEIPASAFVTYVIDSNVFVYGNQLTFAGATVTGQDATIIITGSLLTNQLNGGTSLSVHTIYVTSDVNLNSGSAGLGSSSNPGAIYVNGNMWAWSGARNIYGDLHINGNFNLKDARIHNNVYVNGDLTLGWTPVIDDGAYIYYTGTFTHPDSMSTTITSKCVKVSTVPSFTMPDDGMAPVKSADWYAAKGYSSGGSLTSSMKIFADSYSSTSWMPSAYNVIIVASNGDITLTGLGGSTVTGVLYAPNGKVTFSGASFEGVVLARDGFYVTSGGTQVTFRNLDQYISSSENYPF
jgi:PKD repeat protein